MDSSARRATRSAAWLVLVVAVLTPASGRGTATARTWQGPADGPQVLSGVVRPGVPTVQRFSRDALAVTVTVAPARPGGNLVRLDTAPYDGSAPRELRVGTDPDHLTPAATRPGTDGLWAEVELEPGDNTVYVAPGRSRPVAVSVEAGAATDGGPAAPSLTGADGPECVAAVIGRLVADDASRVTSCPDDTLTHADKGALAHAVAAIVGRGVTEVAIASDLSPRSQQAKKIVRRLVKRAGARLVAPDATPGPHNALLVVTGWQPAVKTLATSGRVARSGGTWLAPWLVTPSGDGPQRYREQLERLLPGATPTATGYVAWLAAQGGRRR